MTSENALLSEKKKGYYVCRSIPPTKKYEEICQDSDSDYQWYKLRLYCFFLIFGICQLSIRPSVFLSIRI